MGIQISVQSVGLWTKIQNDLLFNFKDFPLWQEEGHTESDALL